MLPLIVGGRTRKYTNPCYPLLPPIVGGSTFILRKCHATPHSENATPRYPSFWGVLSRYMENSQKFSRLRPRWRIVEVHFVLFVLFSMIFSILFYEFRKSLRDLLIIIIICVILIYYYYYYYLFIIIIYY